MSKRKWTEDEDAYLEYYLYSGDERSFRSAADFLNRSKESVSTRASKLRKQDENIRYILQPFTEKEIEFIKDNYKELPADKIAERLGRTRGSIIMKAHELGVIKRPRLKQYDAEIRDLASKGYYRSEIARNLNLNAVSVHQYINRHSIECEYAPKEVFQEHAKKWNLNFGK